MKRAAVLALLLAACSRAPDAPSVPDTTSIALPAERAALPETAAGALLTARCTACHSADMLLAQPALAPDKWQATVTKMREVYRAPIAPAEEPAIVAALVALKR